MENDRPMLRGRQTETSGNEPRALQASLGSCFSDVVELFVGSFGRKPVAVDAADIDIELLISSLVTRMLKIEIHGPLELIQGIKILCEMIIDRVLVLPPPPFIPFRWFSCQRKMIHSLR